MSTLRTLVGAARRTYQRLSGSSADRQLRATAETLRQVPVFHPLARSTLMALAEAVHPRTYRRDEFIYYERDPGLGFYVVQRGRVRLSVEDEQSAVHELRQVGEHELFGDLAIAGDFRRLATAQAVIETRVLGFFRPDLKALTKRQPRIGAEVTAALAHHLGTRQMEVMHLVTEREGKVAALRMFEGTATTQNETGEPWNSALDS